MINQAKLQSEPSVQAYLQRIGFAGTPDRSARTLAALQEAHVHTVPYENLEILQGGYPSLAITDLYDKIVVRRRGGYCFELNGLFAWLLRQLDFQVTEYYGRFLLGEDVDIPMRRHRISRVEAEGNIYICDVGVGLPAPRRPLLLTEGILQKQGDETYRFSCDPVLGWVVQTLHKGRWKSLYSFNEEPQYPIDFEMPNHWCVTHPDSKFKKTTMVFIRTPQGRNTIMEAKDPTGKMVREFRRFTPQGLETYIPETRDDYQKALIDYFGIDLE